MKTRNLNQLPLVNPGHDQPPRNGLSNLERVTFSVKEWCKITGLGKTLTQELINSGELHSVMVHGRRLIIASEGKDFFPRINNKERQS